MGIAYGCQSCDAHIEVLAEVAQKPPESPEPPEPPEQFQSDSRISSKGMQVKRCSLDIDPDITRGIFLKDTLRNAGRLWYWSPSSLPEQERASLWSRSHPVERFDLFLSHTWQTRGGWKFLSLSLQFGCYFALAVWILVVALVELLFMVDVLPPQFNYATSIQDYDLSIPFGGWAVCLSVPASILGLLLYPYIPDFGCKKQPCCFLDVVSIHQTDKEKMERGIYGLGGFVSASKELRILWSQPYLSRLWCVFELAAFRTANPQSKIHLAPLNIEAVVAASFLCCFILVVIALPLMPSAEFRLSSGVTAVFIPALVPAAAIFHVLRKSLTLKRQLFSELDAFDLNQVSCREDFDKKFIHEAIVQWYGSLDEFTAYVRGPLRKELLADHSGTSLPLQYTLMIVTPIVSLGIDVITAHIKAGTPYRMVLSYGFGMVLGNYLSYAMFLFWFGMFLCSHFPPVKAPLLSILQSLGLFIVWIVVIMAGLMAAWYIYSRSLLGSVLYCLTTLVLTCSTHGTLKMPWQEKILMFFKGIHHARHTEEAESVEAV
ncbi:hypothetical protein AK812_SmicGene22559 [Symbiodinium microadriaticum]|uniref:Uncharacterized protein n=1 Tax=Symbiodinium microadriaticum TaxID=2951 RepID=A0A1Q9DJI5_SYMMI|nr:hypothetical protein AK812_SmicGene22559 [Symbiodinium microadriaticum]CAE7264100.1 unnamed protein product [Symbiodinium microadriaticum]CAE7905545.1 unnamed protein product [Symbiodinium sp. KB8]